MKQRRLVAMAAGLGCVLASLAILPAPGLVPSASAAITPTGDALAIANSISGPGAVVTGAKFTERPSWRANGISMAGISDFPTDGPTHAVLTSGKAESVDDPNDNKEDNPDSDDDKSSDLGGSSKRGNTDFDVSVLRIDLNVPTTANCLTFDFKFLSEEYYDFVDLDYNDAFVAELDKSTWTTKESAISAPDNFAFDAKGDEVSVNAVGIGGSSPENASGTTYDAATPVLNAVTPVTAGAHSLFLSIFDQGDNVLDSAAFVDNLRVGFVADVEEQCVPGADVKQFQLDISPASATLPTGEGHSVTATLSDLNATPPAVQDAPILFATTGVNRGSGSVSTDASGQATYSYTGVNAGTDTISACYDLDGSRDCGANEPNASTLVHWGAPRIAFTDDRDQLLHVGVDRTAVVNKPESFEPGVRTSHLGPMGPSENPTHEGEASYVVPGAGVFVSAEGDSHGEVYLEYDAAPLRITCNEFAETHPVLSPSQDRVAFASDADGDWDIYVAVLSGEGETGDDDACDEWTVTRVTVDPEAPGDQPNRRVDDLWPAWTQSGDLVFSSARRDALGDLRLAHSSGNGWATRWLTDTPKVEESQPSVGELANGIRRECDGESCDPAPSCGDEFEVDTWVAFTTTAYRPDGSIGVLSLDDPARNITSAWGNETPHQSSEAVWSGCAEHPYLALTSTEQDPYGDIWLASVATPTVNPVAAPQIVAEEAVVNAPGVAESHATWWSAFEPPEPTTTGDFDTAELLFTSRTIDPEQVDDGRLTDADITEVVATDGSDRRTIIDKKEFGDETLVRRFDEAGPSYSPDGQLIAYTFDADDVGRTLALANADGSGAEALDYERGSGDIDLDPVWSPNGREIAFTRLVPDGHGGYKDPVAAIVSVEAEGTTSGVRIISAVPEGHDGVADQYPGWSPDGKQIVLARTLTESADPGARRNPGGPAEGGLWIVDASGPPSVGQQLFYEHEILVCDCPPPVVGRSPDWSPDGSTIAFEFRGALRTIDIDSGKPNPSGTRFFVPDAKAVTGFNGAEQKGTATPSRSLISAAHDPAWSPNGTEIAFAGQPAGQPDQSGIYAIKPDGSGLRTVADDRRPETEPAWSPGEDTVEGPDVAVDLTITGSPAAPGEPVTATYTVENVGDSSAADVNLETTFTAGGTAQAVDPTAGCEVDGSGCSLGTIAPDDPPLVYVVTLTYPITLEGVATGAVGTTSEDSNVANDMDEEPFRIQTVGLSVTLTLDEPTGFVGGRRAATVEVRNSGPDVAEGVTLAMKYPTTLVTPKAPEPCLNGGLVPCELEGLTPDEPQSFQVPMDMLKDGTGLIVATVESSDSDPTTDPTAEPTTEPTAELMAEPTTDDPTSDSAEVPIEVLQPTIRLLPAVARPGQVVLAYGESMPPGSKVTLKWTPGIMVAPGPYRVEKDGTMRAPLLIVRRDVVSRRELTATSTEALFTPVAGELLVVLRSLMAPTFVGRG